MDDETILSSHQVAKILQASPSAVIGWFDRGSLVGFRTPGGHRRVKAGELRRFLEAHNMPIPVALAGPQQKPLDVYIIDDEELVIRTLERSFRLSDYAVEVRSSTSAVEALIDIGGNPPDVILLDIYMGTMDGFEVCHQLGKLDRLKDVIVVGMSAKPSDEDAERLIDAGGQAYLGKGFTIEQFMEILPPNFRRTSSLPIATSTS